MRNSNAQSYQKMSIFVSYYKKKAMELIFATQNKGKLREAQEICDVLGARYGVQVTVLPMPEKADIPETGSSYMENSMQKAQWIWERYGASCFADDSGLEVEALGGAPGIHTARYCHRDFASGMDSLLYELEQKGAMEPQQRRASFECCITLMLSSTDAPQGVEAGKPLFFEGHCQGRISPCKCGDQGFGFDPVFMPDAHPDMCMAQLEDSVKNLISHRGLALEQMFRFLANKKQQAE